MAVVRIRTTFSGAGAVGGGLNTSYWFVTTPDVASAQVAVDKMRDWWTALAPGMYNGISWAVQGIVAVWNPATQQISSELICVTRSGAGTNAGDMLPPATQGLVTWRTTFFTNGRRVQGHWFIPGPTEVESSNSGAPLAAYTSRISTAAGVLQAGTDPQLAVNSRASTTVYAPVTGSAGTKFAVLRSRRD